MTGSAATVERIDGCDDTYPNRRWTTWRVTYKGHLLGNAVDEAEGWRWVEDMRRMEAAGDYDPTKAESDRLAHLQSGGER